MEPNETGEEREQVEQVASVSPQQGGRMKISTRVLLGLVPVALLVLGGASFLLYSPASEAAPRVSWTPGSLSVEAEPGQIVIDTVTLKHTSRLPIPLTKQLQVVPVGETEQFEQYVTVTQPKFPRVFRRGQSVDVPVTVSVPQDAPTGVVQGKLVLQRVIGNRVTEVWRAEALAVDLTFSPVPLPPDPGEAGKVTIEGIDSDGDGVRDDVQRWIVFTAPRSESAQAALNQSARALQEFLLADNDEKVRAAAHKQDDAIECLFFVRGDRNDAAEALARLRAEQLNTLDRSRKYVQLQTALDGEVFGSTPVEWQYKCAFDPWALDTEARNQ